ncbi:hypothetical protein UlMin_017447 [Ulmus minor]
MVIKTNPGSLAVVQSESVGEPPHFKRIFICLQACAHGFMQGCRGIVGLDGCHLKGPFGGIMLGAVSLDANLQFFPLAYAIVEVEDKDSWAWFLTMLRDGVGENLDVRPWVLISDRQKGLIKAAGEVLPECTHRMCCHHILQNWQKMYKVPGLKDMFWEAANATNVYEFRLAMDKIRAENEAAYGWLTQLETRSWALHAMDSRVKCEHITSNFVESWNAWIGEERYKPPITMLENIRSKIMDLIYNRGQ